MPETQKSQDKCMFCGMTPAKNKYDIFNFLTSSKTSYMICDECKEATDHAKKDKFTRDRKKPNSDNQ